MFNVGGPEVVVILIVALLILGPEQLPKAMRTFGHVMAEIRKVSGGFQDEMRRAMNEIDPRKVIEGTTSTATPSTADGTEVVARNPAEPDPTTGAGTDEDEGDDPGPGGGPAGPEDPGPPPISPADRAAG